MTTVKRRGLLGVVLLLVLGLGAGYTADSGNEVRIVAEFEHTTGLYRGSDVRVLGVKIGKVIEVEPRGDRVRVTMEVDGDQPVPAAAMAAIVAPSLVSGRYIQLAPAYTEGPTLADGASIPFERTAVPVEWDDIKHEITRLTTALAPRRHRSNGPLSRVVHAAADAFAGNGDAMRAALASMADAADTLSGSRQNLFLTVRGLADFLTALNESGGNIRAFTRELRSISSLLATNRHQLRNLLERASSTATVVRDFVVSNRSALDESIDGIASVSDQLADNQVNLANILHLAPTTLANFYNIYDPSAGTLTGRFAMGQTMGMANMVCQGIFSAGGSLEDCQRALGPLMDMFNMESLPLSVNPLNQPGTSNQADPGEEPTESSTPERRTDAVDELTHLLLGGGR